MTTSLDPTEEHQVPLLHDLVAARRSISFDAFDDAQLRPQAILKLLHKVELHRLFHVHCANALLAGTDVQWQDAERDYLRKLVQRAGHPTARKRFWLYSMNWPRLMISLALTDGNLDLAKGLLDEYFTINDAFWGWPHSPDEIHQFYNRRYRYHADFQRGARDPRDEVTEGHLAVFLDMTRKWIDQILGYLVEFERFFIAHPKYEEAAFPLGPSQDRRPPPLPPVAPPGHVRTTSTHDKLARARDENQARLAAQAAARPGAKRPRTSATTYSWPSYPRHLTSEASRAGHARLTHSRQKFSGVVIPPLSVAAQRSLAHLLSRTKPKPSSASPDPPNLPPPAPVPEPSPDVPSSNANTSSLTSSNSLTFPPLAQVPKLPSSQQQHPSSSLSTADKSATTTTTSGAKSSQDHGGPSGSQSQSLHSSNSLEYVSRENLARRRAEMQAQNSQGPMDAPAQVDRENKAVRTSPAFAAIERHASEGLHDEELVEDLVEEVVMDIGS